MNMASHIAGNVCRRTQRTVFFFNQQMLTFVRILIFVNRRDKSDQKTIIIKRK